MGLFSRTFLNNSIFKYGGLNIFGEKEEGGHSMEQLEQSRESERGIERERKRKPIEA